MTSPDASYMLPASRIEYYNPMLDLALQLEKMTPEMVKAIDEDKYNYGSDASGGPLETPDALHPANLISSLCTDGFHRPALDIDVNFVEYVREFEELNPLADWGSHTVVFSESWGGNTHMYIPTLPLTWDAYQVFMKQYDPGFIDDRWMGHSFNREQSLLRFPGYPKTVVSMPGLHLKDFPRSKVIHV